MNARKAIPALFLAASLAGACIAQAEGKHWSYGPHGGPTEWGQLDPAYATCKLGKFQSPIDIRGANPADLPAIRFDYKASPLKVIDNGHTIQVNYAPGSSIEVGGTRYELLQFHFHKPSEEKVEGKAYAMVAHLVHKSADGKLAVVAVLFKQGKENATLKPVFAKLPAKEGDKVALEGTIDVAALLPADHGYYSFPGSLTTPPCSEEVRWQVLKTPVEISGAQLASFRKLYKMNARPVQPLNERQVVLVK